MRLIDKDWLLKGTNHYWLEMENFGDIESIDIRFVEMAEEVKAIPVEWIEEWVVKKYAGAGRIIDCLLEDWEKENETGNSNRTY